MNELEQGIQSGLEALELGDTSLALKHFSAAIEAVNSGGIDDRNFQAQALRRRGTLYLDLGRPHDAITDLTRSIELNPNDPQALQTRAFVRLALNNPTGAITDLRAAITLNETDPLSHQLVGTALRRCTQIDAAIASFTRAARLYFDRGEPEKSRQCLAQIDCLRPTSPSPSSASASPTAILNASSLPSSRPNPTLIDPRAFYRQAIERAEAGDAAGALSDLEWVLKNGALDAEALCCRAAIYSTLGRFQAALADFNRVLKEDDRSAMAYGGRGRARLRLGDGAGAVADFDRAIAMTQTMRRSSSPVASPIAISGTIVKHLPILNRRSRSMPTAEPPTSNAEQPMLAKRS
ncbi:MAG: tetratricopeptide repeat protein [Coleofasciculaceae cyanobacterium RL_1_1]|nr:tetratricopeptide repeat protein [Coleofasciculaceae cyanobacterium RL_1_1]